MFRSLLMMVYIYYICTQVVIQPSSRRAYTMREYENAGAALSDDLSHTDTILGAASPDVTCHCSYQNSPHMEIKLECNGRLWSKNDLCSIFTCTIFGALSNEVDFWAKLIFVTIYLYY